jgi:hypothetical protein
MGKKKITILIIVLVVIILAGLYFVYANFFAGKVSEVTQPLFPKLKTGFALEILKDPKFSALIPHGKLPVVISQKGKVNPFMKF